jgi:hypothetical protein
LAIDQGERDGVRPTDLVLDAGRALNRWWCLQDVNDA